MEETKKTTEEKEDLKFCKYCGEKIPKDAVICTKCGRQVEDIKKDSTEQIVINNNNNAVASATAIAGGYGRPKNKWVALLLCIFLGVFGVHKFYEGKVGMGLLYLFTFGLFGFGVLIDFIIILCHPNPYYV